MVSRNSARQDGNKAAAAGWLSLPFYWLTGSWELAWRLPGYLCTPGNSSPPCPRSSPPAPGLRRAAGGFRLWSKPLTPRMATLVRTDMMLALWIWGCGWLIYRKIDSGQPWTRSEKWVFFGAMLAAVLTRGQSSTPSSCRDSRPFGFSRPRSAAPLFGAVGGHGSCLSDYLPHGLSLAVRRNPEFYNDVVVNEFMSRFDQSLKAHEKQQPIWFCFPHLLHKFAPWSLLSLALPIISENVKAQIPVRSCDPWLACWALGGLLCMTFVPSKRVDRFPVISAVPAACFDDLGLPMWQACARVVRCRRPPRGACRFFLFHHRNRDGLPQRR